MSETWMCGAFGPYPGYRCTRPTGHGGRHESVVAGEMASAWTNADTLDPPTEQAAERARDAQPPTEGDS